MRQEDETNNLSSATGSGGIVVCNKLISFCVRKNLQVNKHKNSCSDHSTVALHIHINPKATSCTKLSRAWFPRLLINEISQATKPLLWQPAPKCRAFFLKKCVTLCLGSNTVRSRKMHILMTNARRN